jgi:hypothetical protein
MKQITRFTVYPQEAADWCWPAVIQMLQHYFLAGSQTQPAIAAACKGEFCCQSMAVQDGPHVCPHPCLQGLTWRVTGRNEPLAWETLCQEIEADRPVVIAWGGHMCICVGYDPLGRLLSIFNPLPVSRGRLETLAYHEYAGLFNAQSWFGIQPAQAVRPQ